MNYSVFTKFKAIDAMTPAFTKMQGSATKFQTKMSMGFANIKNNWSKFSSSIMNMQNAFRFLAITLGIKALSGAIYNLASTADRLVKTSNSIGITAQRLAELTFVGDRLGVSQDVITTGLQRLNKNMGDLRTGTGTMLEAIGRLDSSLYKQLKTATNTSEAFEMIIEASTKMQDPFKKTTLLVSAFGRTGVEMMKLTKAGAGAIKLYTDKFREYAGVLNSDALDGAESFMDSMANMKSAMFGLYLSMSKYVLPELAKLIDNFAKWVAETKGQAVKDFAENIKSISQNFATLSENISKTVNGMLFIGKALVGWTILKTITVSLAPLLLGIASSFGIVTKAVIATGTATAVAKTGMIAFAASFGFTPIGMLVAGIGALVGLTAVLWLNSAKFRDSIGGVFKFFGGMFSNLFGIIKMMGSFNKGKIYSGAELSAITIEKLQKKSLDNSTKMKENYLASAKAMKDASEAENFKSNAEKTNRLAPISRTIMEIRQQELLRSAAEKMYLGIEVSPKEGTFLEQMNYKVKGIKGLDAYTTVTTSAGSQ
jgi:hypothetical protein